MSSVLVVGGSGLLGFHTVLELVARGHRVTSLSLPPVATDITFPDGVQALWGDVATMTDDELTSLLTDMDAVVYAAGADERTVPPAPAAHFFHEANVRPTQRMARLARAAGVTRFVLFGSYTAEFAERFDDLGYRTHNGYPRTRLAQEEAAYLEGDGAMDVMVLRLPYIFGLVGQRRPLWQFVLDRVQAPGPVAVLGGSTSSVTVRQVAQAAVGAMESGTHGARYAINGYDLTYAELYRLACEAVGRDPQDVVVVPLEAMLPYGPQADAAAAAQGTEHGIHVVDSLRFQDRDAVSDIEPTASTLGMEPDDVVAAIRETFRWCVEHPVATPVG
ncbi:NAD-dependent epimerase/dehydratase family protein [Cellulomonas sp. zg-ZUI222]|uniref:NAD-dependent epimerase/dehydratase family protein n=1 Tax=Cellulomonas wangleii TaxID=2816956 RepID=A0ABX8D4Q0_9CELL|nr:MULTISPECIES: NAD-dependent epimerase/dehydratase family protein [Cellulomonas]MBO0898555.1 NAD-dependent epimerase/dehydratase family protein [Cellulomonas sp. zg-ZUI22]MBO0919419.1 NAD-dependent epimerase/dehydratase family protein [Cellulomonas wangleii]MBO0924443.1 NAD-dependent epimerase/dehydratase family protein [Cellulomonas wangleii]QVI62437.1 NAD-dependent epimerase/dehydratase family protein [Cellulomonas wangleii]